MDHNGSSNKVFDEVDIACQCSPSMSDDEHDDDIDARNDESVCSGCYRYADAGPEEDGNHLQPPSKTSTLFQSFRQNQANTRSATPDIVVPNPGVSRDDEEYFMGNRERGVALIFNHETFDERRNPRGRCPPDRMGTNADKEALRDTFRNLGFQVFCFDNLRHGQINEELNRVAEQDHSNRDCVAVAVLSHGESDGRLDARDEEYHVSELWEPFISRRCRTLAAKPKLFFIQACKGRGFGRGVLVSDVATDAPDANVVEQLTYPVPCYADILVSYSTFEGQYSFRNKLNGSWYVQTLCSQLQDHGKTKDLVSLLTGVNRIVGQKFRSVHTTPDLSGMVQGPCFTSSLTRSLCFGQKHLPSSTGGCL